jgi:oligopeptide/dipeptide ABC transporter ATP-binding protein
MTTMTGTQTETVAATPGAEPPLIEVRNLGVEFPAGGGRWTKAISDVSLAVRPGESVALVGESGSGKTVTSLAMMGLTKATGGRISEGTVTFEGRDLTALPDREWRTLRGPAMGMIFQQPIRSLNPAFTVGDQIAESVRRHLGLSRKAAWARAIEMLKMVEIPRAESRVKEYPHAFSGGMCQRVMIAMVMATNPRLLIADEPTTALDVTMEAQIIHLLRELRRDYNGIIIVVSHHLGVIAELCDRVYVMYAGEVVEGGEVDAIFHDARHPYTQALLACDPARFHERLDRLPTIPGSLPNLTQPPSGCVYAPRCDRAFAPCSAIEPPLVKLAASHVARCHAVTP